VQSTGAEVNFADRTTLLPIGCVKTVQLLIRETPDFIAPTLWPANSSDLSPVHYLIWGKLQECIPQPDSLRRPAEVSFYRRAGTFQPDDQLIIDKAVRQ